MASARIDLAHKCVLQVFIAAVSKKAVILCSAIVNERGYFCNP